MDACTLGIFDAKPLSKASKKLGTKNLFWPDRGYIHANLSFLTEKIASANKLKTNNK